MSTGHARSVNILPVGWERHDRSRRIRCGRTAVSLIQAVLAGPALKENLAVARRPAPSVGRAGTITAASTALAAAAAAFHVLRTR
jgi:hypothetical protein